MPEGCGTVQGLDHVDVVDRLAYGSRPHDRLVAVEDALDAQHRLGIVLALVARVIAGVFAERALLHQLIRVDVAFGDDLGIGRQREPGQIGFEHRHRAAAQRAGNIVFVHVGADQGRGGEEQHRIGAHHVGRGHQFAPLLVFLQVHVAMLALDDLRAEDILAEHLRAVGAKVGPAGIGILRHQKTGGNEEAAAVVRIEPGRREHLDIDGIALDDVLLHLRIVDILRLNHLLGGEFHPLLRQLAHRQRRVLLQGNGQPLRGGEGAGEYRNVVALDVLVEQCRPLLLLIHLRDMAELEFPVHLGLDAVQLAVRLQRGDVAAQIVDRSHFGTCIRVRSV